MFQALVGVRREEDRPGLQRTKGVAENRLSRYWLALGDNTRAMEAARKAAGDSKNEVEPLAAYVDVLYRCGKGKEAEEKFKELRAHSAWVDLDAPVFQRLALLASSLRLSSDWRIAYQPAKDLGPRPAMDSLG